MKDISETTKACHGEIEKCPHGTPQGRQKIAWWGSGHIKRGGGRLEILKFAIYFFIPILASVVYNYPNNQHRLVSIFNYIIYPAEGPRPPDGDEIIRRNRAHKQNNIKPKIVAIAIPKKYWWTFGH